MSGYVGNAGDKMRIQRMQKEREEREKAMAAKKDNVETSVKDAGVRTYVAASNSALDTAFKNETVGLVTLEEFKTKRDTLAERHEAEALLRKREAAEAQLAEREERRNQKAKLAAKSKLSFMGEDEDEEEVVMIKPSKKKYGKLGKNPGVNTTFLKDKDREVEEEQLREKLKKEWQEKQTRIKDQEIEITYSYWDGQGHRRRVMVRKGDSVGEFLKKAQTQLQGSFREMRHASLNNLLYIKEDLILPHSTTFYDLIISKARGKSGPLFKFDVHEDVRVVNDARTEKEDTHAGKVVERHWYEKNKHIYPASRWEPFDPEKDYGSYAIADK